MGCICSKGIYLKDKDNKLTKSSKKYAASSLKDDAVIEVDGRANDATSRLISSPLETNDEGDKNKAIAVTGNTNENPVRILQRRLTLDIGVSSLPNGEKGAQVVTGWPPWLTAEAGEAIAGWAPRRAESFERLEKIGQGTYSNVYKARDLDTNKIVALKKVRFANMDPESVRFMAREIIILRKLDHPNVMNLEGLITSKVSRSLYLIFEYMEHDLAGLAATAGVKFTESQGTRLPGGLQLLEIVRVHKLGWIQGGFAVLRRCEVIRLRWELVYAGGAGPSKSCSPPVEERQEMERVVLFFTTIGYWIRPERK